MAIFIIVVHLYLVRFCLHTTLGTNCLRLRLLLRE
ncbi:hypothetical protein EVA_13602 [gut metagenome]|uniref:Uncharacterized protein n=1 Tax=gut metagenome TaxID=749906 RepID=J9GG26_9ZZZZ